MSFIDSAVDVLDRTEGSLSALIADALKAKAYREIGTIAAMVEAVAAIGPGRSREGKRAVEVGVGAGVGAGTHAAPEPAKASEPSWMRPKA